MLLVVSQVANCFSPTQLSIPAEPASCLQIHNIYQMYFKVQNYTNSSFQPFIYFCVNIVFYLKFQQLTDGHQSWQKNQPLIPTPID